VHDEIVDEFWQGVEQFNQQQFYACHDTLEAIWMESMEPQRTFYQGVLQIAVALYHLENENWHGTVTLLGEGMRRLRIYQPDYGGMDVTALVQQSAALLGILQQLGAEQIGAVRRSLHPPNQPSSLSVIKNPPHSAVQLPYIRKIK
jgi:uncharacterized protein